jgi:hypothetical protein
MKLKNNCINHKNTIGRKGIAQKKQLVCQDTVLTEILDFIKDKRKFDG